MTRFARYLLVLALLPVGCGDSNPGLVTPGTVDAGVEDGLDDQAEAPEGPRLVAPGELSFGLVLVGQSATVSLSLANLGDQPLVIDGFAFTGPASFTLQDGPTSWGPQPKGTAPVTLAPAWELAPGTSRELTVTFAPTVAGEGLGELRLFTNDPGLEAGAAVALAGEGAAPCLEVVPEKVDFGGKLVGKQAEIDVELRSCGKAPLTLHGLRLVDDSASDFMLDLTKLSSETTGVSELGPNETTVSIPPGQSAWFTVRFTPDQVDSKAPDGTVLADLGTIEILSDATVEPILIEVRGFGGEIECPTPVVKVQEGEEVIAQTKLHLIGSQSAALNGPIAKYQWTVTQPNGSASLLLPSASAPDPTFEVNVAGTYAFCLEVWDQVGVKSCEPTCYTVVVQGEEAIRIELTWVTPNDPDPNDAGTGAGADLDLHFLHPFATGLDLDGNGTDDGWFDNPFDCYWFTPSPEWGSFDPLVQDNPELLPDDFGGGGPEIIRMAMPEDGMRYRVGLHEWNANGFGTSFATVRIFIYGELAFEVEALELGPHAFCEIASIDWPAATVTSAADASGAFPCTPFVHPLAEVQP